MIFLAELQKIARDLGEANASWCLVGGLATSVYIDPRTTRDIDVLITVPGDENSEKLRTFLVTTQLVLLRSR
jgi:hypothetical protein